MTNPLQLDEVLHQAILKQWLEEAKTVDSVDGFIDRLVTAYEHDYGTIVHACLAVMYAAFSRLNRSKQGGITGFQAGCLSWMLIRKFSDVRDDAPLRLIDYSNMLYPQYKYRFEKIIEAETWEYLQNEAKKLLEKDDANMAPEVKVHMQTIVRGLVPFGYKVKESDES